jgi:hypothetical protein
MTVQEYGRVPFIPEKALRKHKVHELADHRFRSAARARQALLREERGWAIGLYPPNGERQRELGSYLGDTDEDSNFISADVARLVRREVAYREDDALIDEVRLYRNLLTSAATTFNLIGPLKLNLRLATSVMRRLLPDFVRQVTGVLFEHSPARRDPNFTADRTAFDALIKVKTTTGENAFVALEIKFTETMTETPARLRPRYNELSASSGLFKDPDHLALRTTPLNQLWRQHMLAAAMVQNKLYGAGRFIVIAPSLNGQAQHAIYLYRQHLINSPATVGFEAVPLENFVAAIKRAGATETATLLHERYCDYGPLDALI